VGLLGGYTYGFNATTRALGNTHHTSQKVRITGGRLSLVEIEDELAAKLYSEIRGSISDVQTIAKHPGIPDFQMRRVKAHLFYNTHQLNYGTGIARFDPDFQIATAWKRLEAGNPTKAAHTQYLINSSIKTAAPGAFSCSSSSGISSSNTIVF